MIRLAVDASVLVAESLRSRGLALIANTDLELFIATPAWSEALHELRRRLLIMEARGRFSVGLSERAFHETVDALRRRITRVPEAEYAIHEPAARKRIPRDPNDWPNVALALALDAAIWTSDYDFFGCGVATWTTETLLAQV